MSEMNPKYKTASGPRLCHEKTGQETRGLFSGDERQTSNFNVKEKKVAGVPLSSPKWRKRWQDIRHSHLQPATKISVLYCIL
jgi:hypothetical protein